MFYKFEYLKIVDSLRAQIKMPKPTGMEKKRKKKNR